MGDDPPYLVVGTEVSAKYKGAFCEAKIKKIVRLVKCKVTFKGPGLGATLLSDDQIKGPLRVGALVEAKHPSQSLFVEATINKIQDCSQYTVVFDDGDITTLRRSALCLKSGRHFNESETLDQLPLTHPEHFSNPVIGGRRGIVSKRSQTGSVEDTCDDEDLPAPKRKRGDGNETDVGKVVCVENTEKKKTKENWFPALVVSSSAQESAKIRTKDEYLVRSFRDGRYYTVPKKETAAFTKDSPSKMDVSSSVLRSAVDKALLFIERDELPPHWDRDVLFTSGSVDIEHGSINEDIESSESDESEEDPNAEERNRFVAQLYKFMDERGTPINKVPVVCNKDLDLYKLYKIVSGKGGYNKVTNSSQWKPVTQKMGFGAMPSTSTINLIKQAYKRFIHNYEEFHRKLGCSLSNIPSGSRGRSSRYLFKRKPLSKDTNEDEQNAQKLIAIANVDTDSEVLNSEAETKILDTPDGSSRARSRQDSRNRTKEMKEDEDLDKKERDSKKKRLIKEKDVTDPIPDVPIVKSMRGKSKRNMKDDCPVEENLISPEKDIPGPTREHISPSVNISLGDRLRVYYGPKHDGKVTYEAKVTDIDEPKQLYLVHYTGWNTRYDEWIPRLRICENLSLAQDPVTSTPQGRGPVSTPEMDSEVPFELRAKSPTKARKKKFVSTPLLGTNTNTTRSKSVAIGRIRVSSETENAQNLVALSIEDGSQISECEFVTVDPGTLLTCTVHSPSHGVVEPGSETDATSKKISLEKERKTKTLDLSKIADKNVTAKKISTGKERRINLSQRKFDTKGPDKITNLDSLPVGSAGTSTNIRMDIYDFQDDLTETPSFKTFAPRSPGKKDEASKETELTSEPPCKLVSKEEQCPNNTQVGENAILMDDIPDSNSGKQIITGNNSHKGTKRTGSPNITEPSLSLVTDGIKPEECDNQDHQHLRTLPPLQIKQNVEIIETPLPLIAPISLQITLTQPGLVMEPKTGRAIETLTTSSLNVDVELDQHHLTSAVPNNFPVKLAASVKLDESKDEPCGVIKQKPGSSRISSSKSTSTPVSRAPKPKHQEPSTTTDLRLPNFLSIEHVQPSVSVCLSVELSQISDQAKLLRTNLESQLNVHDKNPANKQHQFTETTDTSAATVIKKTPRRIKKAATTASSIDIILKPATSKCKSFNPCDSLQDSGLNDPATDTDLTSKPPDVHNVELLLHKGTPKMTITSAPIPNEGFIVIDIDQDKTDSTKIPSNVNEILVPIASSICPLILERANELTEYSDNLQLDINRIDNESNPRKQPASSNDGKLIIAIDRDRDLDEPSLQLDKEIVLLAEVRQNDVHQELTEIKGVHLDAHGDIKLDKVYFRDKETPNKGEEESCNSLWCEEEIPGSPPPGIDSSRCSFDERNEQFNHGKIIVETPQELITSHSPSVKPLNGSDFDNARNQLKQPAEESLHRANKLESYRKEDELSYYNSQTMKTRSEYADLVEDNTPPATPESSSISSNSDRCEESRMSPNGNTFKEPSDTDSYDGMSKIDGTNDDGSNSSDAEQGQRVSSASFHGTSRLKKRMQDRSGRNPYVSSPKRNRRVMQQMSPDEEADSMYSYRVGRTSIRDSHALPVLPPMTIPKPPRTTKYYFIPDVGDNLEPEERIAILSTSLQDLKEKYALIKSQLTGIERKRKKFKRREREKASATACGSSLERKVDTTQSMTNHEPA